MRAFKAFFLSRALREKLLLLAFLGIGLAIWLSGFSTRAGELWRQTSRTKAELDEQSLVLARRAAIEENAAAAVGRFVPSRTFTGTRLAGEVNLIAEKVGVSKLLHTQSPKRTSAGSFTVNELQFDLRGIEWDALKAFERELQQRAPYISLEDVRLNAAGNPNLLAAVFRISSVEIAQ